MQPDKNDERSIWSEPLKLLDIEIIAITTILVALGVWFLWFIMV